MKNRNGITVSLRPRKKTGTKKKKKSKAQTQAVQQEIGLLGRALRSLGSAAGTAAGGLFGAPIAGGAAGHGLGAAVSQWLGAGDYTVSSNSVVSQLKASNGIPMMHTNDQTVTIRHKEFLCEVLSNTTFSVLKSFTLNPGNRTTFPWLAPIANCYQQYRIKGLVFHYIPTSGTFSGGANAALGSVMLQTTYRSSDTPPSSKVELLNEFWACESVPSETFAHPIECAPGENPFNTQYVRGVDIPIPAGDSPLLYDLGTTHLCVSGQQASGVTLGDLWVTYEVELKKPIMASNVTPGDGFYANAVNTTPTFADPFGNMVLNNVGNMMLTFGSGRSINLPASSFGTFTFLVRYKPSATFTNPTTAGAPVVTNCTLINLSFNSDRWEDNVSGGGVDAAITYAIRVRKTQRETTAGIQFPLASASAGTLASVEVILYGYSDT